MGLRVFRAARATWGLACLAVPDQMLTRVYRTAPDPVARPLLRVLGARHLVQALVSTSPRAERLGVVVDVLHASSMVALALVPTYRRAALTDTAVASGFALLGARRPT